MREKLEFAAILFCLAWATYRYFRTKDSRVIYGIIVFASIFSAKQPFQLPIEFILSFNGLFCFSILLYKSMRCFTMAPINKSTFSNTKTPKKDSTPARFRQELLALSVLSLFFAITFLVQGFVFPGLTLPIGNILAIVMEFSLAFCAFLGCGVLLHRIFRYKADRNLIIFSLIFLMFGTICLLQGFSLIPHFLI